MQKVQVGQPFRGFPAEVYNNLIDLLESPGRLGDGDTIFGRKNTGIIDVYNGTGADIDVGEVIGITGPYITPTDNENEFSYNLALDGDEPALATHLGKFAIAVEPIASGDVGKCCVSGLCVAKVNVTTADAFDLADVTDGETAYLTAAGRGAAEIKWIQSGTGTKWAIVCLGPLTSKTYWGTLASNLLYSDTTGVTVNLDTGGSIGNVLPSETMTWGYWPSTSEVKVEFFADNKWYATLGPCPSEIP